MNKHYHTVPIRDADEQTFMHSEARRECIKCEGCETWLRRGEGIGPEAECPLVHGTAPSQLECYLSHPHSGDCHRDDEFTTHDSGERIDYPSGMRRDTTKGKLRFDLIPLFMLKRVAGLYTRGAEKYGDNNWQLANSEEELTRFKASAFRHFVQWLDGERDEDHGAAVFFNIAAAEHCREKVEGDQRVKDAFKAFGL